MDWPKSCIAVAPCCNEGATIGHVVRATRTHLPEVLVVDDGSEDNTVSEAGAAGARVLSHATNLGKGAALKTGFQAALAAGFDWALTLDGDGQHNPADIPALLACAETTGAALIIGNRMHVPQAIPWLRRQVNRWMSRQLSRRLGHHLPDTQCGFRLLDLRAWKGLPHHTGHFEVESELLTSFVGAGLLVEFVPIQVIGRGPASHIRPVLDTWRWFRWWRAGASGFKFTLPRRFQPKHPERICRPVRPRPNLP